MTTTTVGRGISEADLTTTSARRGMSKTIVNMFLAIGMLYALLPLLWLVLAASKSNAGVLSGDLFSFRELDLPANLSTLAHTEGGIYFRWYANSIGYSVFGAGTTGLICVAAGYAFEKYRFRGKEKLYGLVLLGVLIPGMATTLPLYLIASKVHLVNTLWSVLLPYMVSPFGVLLGRIYAAAYVSDEVIEAARVDGAGELKIFRSIALPVLWPGFATIALFQFSGVWNSFYLPYLMLNNEKLYPVNLGLYMWNLTANVEDPQYTAMVLTGSVLAILPVIAVFIGLQRFWRSGINAGSIK
jgi:multiple sugar transport system permease protein